MNYAFLFLCPLLVPGSRFLVHLASDVYRVVGSCRRCYVMGQGPDISATIDLKWRLEVDVDVDVMSACHVDITRYSVYKCNIVQGFRLSNGHEDAIYLAFCPQNPCASLHS